MSRAPEFVRELFSHGKVTIPREVRKLFHLKDGDLVTLRIVDIVRSTDRSSPLNPVIAPKIEIQADSETAIGAVPGPQRPPQPSPIPSVPDQGVLQ